jgi:hypothetical protein
MNKTKAFDMDGYELSVGDYVASAKTLYRITRIAFEEKANTQVLELMRHRDSRMVKKSDFEVERLN